MTDPLRPFADAIRSLWSARARATPETSASARTTSTTNVRAPGTDAQAQRSSRSLESRLKARISAQPGIGAAKLREVFVETVLLWELGEQLAPDPAFSEMVAQVADQLAANSAVSERLNRALARLATTR